MIEIENSIRNPTQTSPHSIKEVFLQKVSSADIKELKEYISLLYQTQNNYESILNIEEGLSTLLKHDSLGKAFYVLYNEKRVGYVIILRYVSIERGGIIFFIDELFIEKQVRGLGIGGEVLKQVNLLAQQENALFVTVQVEKQDDKAQRFFYSHGFSTNNYVTLEKRM